MKKFITFFIISILIFINSNTTIAENIGVYATVGEINHIPIIVEITPSSDPKIIRVGATQSYSIKFMDSEFDEISYTITADDGFLNTTSGTFLSSSYSDGYGYINFTYLAPSSAPSGNFSKIYLTLNDGTDIVLKELNLYIY